MAWFGRSPCAGDPVPLTSQPQSDKIGESHVEEEVNKGPTVHHRGPNATPPWEVYTIIEDEYGTRLRP